MKDEVGLFDTKLVYRFFAQPENYLKIDPNASLNKAQTLKITYDSASNKNYLSFENFDDTWTFDNVLVTGNLESKITQVNASVFVDGYLPDKDKTINRNVLNGTANKNTFYCAIYAISTLNDSPVNYNLTKYTS